MKAIRYKIVNDMRADTAPFVKKMAFPMQLEFQIFDIQMEIWKFDILDQIINISYEKYSR